MLSLNVGILDFEAGLLCVVYEVGGESRGAAFLRGEHDYCLRISNVLATDKARFKFPALDRLLLTELAC